MPVLPKSVDATVELLREGNYIAQRSLATAVFLSISLDKPLFLEGEAGVGKTEIAKVLANVLGKKLIRLQCYEGMDVTTAVYEWNYPFQMIQIRMAESQNKENLNLPRTDIFDESFLVKRPLLQALEGDKGNSPILLIDELDRTDEPFEAYLLEVLSDFQITIPEIGTMRAKEPPMVVITSNRTREVHDAIKRRCLYHWVDYPSLERELKILQLKAPSVREDLSNEVVSFVQKLRKIDLFKAPGISETIDWANALIQLDCELLEPNMIDETLGALLKYHDDISRVRGSEADRILEEVRSDNA